MVAVRTYDGDGQSRTDVDLAQTVELPFGPIYDRWMPRTGPLTESHADGPVELSPAALA